MCQELCSHCGSLAGSSPGVWGLRGAQPTPGAGRVECSSASRPEKTALCLPPELPKASDGTGWVLQSSRWDV